MLASRLLVLLLSLKALVEVRGQDSPDPGKEEGFKDLITENNLDEK